MFDFNVAYDKDTDKHTVELYHKYFYWFSNSGIKIKVKTNSLFNARVMAKMYTRRVSR